MKAIKVTPKVVLKISGFLPYLSPIDPQIGDIKAKERYDTPKRIPLQADWALGSVIPNSFINKGRKGTSILIPTD